MAIVKIPFKGVPDGEFHPVRFNVGDEVTGELAIVALLEGWAVEKKSLKAAPQNKAHASSPANKSSSSRAAPRRKKKTSKKSAKKPA